MRAIKNKLRGQAQMNVSTRLEIQNWSEIKQILTQTLCDPRDIEQDLIHFNFDPKRESLINTSNKILQNQSLIRAKLKQSSENSDVNSIMQSF